MAFRVVVVAVLVALASAGYDADYMNMMHQMMNMHQGGGNMGGNGGGNMGGNGDGGMQQGGGCNPATGGCQIPQGVDVGEYLKQQQEQQQFETQKMAEKMKAQFEAIMTNVTMRKHRYALSVMTEFTSMCACAKESLTIYQTLFVETAKTLGMADVIDLTTINTLPYQAKSAKEARELIFAGMLNSLCTALGNFMVFAQEVENNIPTFQTNPVTIPPGK